MKKAKRKPKLRDIIIIALICICSIVAVSYAKYNNQIKNNNAYTAENFYFESDLLKETEGAEYTFGEGETTVAIKLSNNADNLRYTESNIGYEVTLTDETGKEINKKTGTLTGGQISTETVSFENVATGTYTVTAKALTPYTKTLTGKFTIKAASNDISYTVKDSSGSTNLNVTLTTNSYSGTVTITFPEALEPNNVETDFKELTSTSAKLEVKPNSEYNIQFFKTDTSKAYTQSDITVSK